MDRNGSPTEPDLELLVLYEGEQPPVEIVPAGRWRDWMNATSNRFANRCLPLLMANQAGWTLLNPTAFDARWDGGEDATALVVEHGSEGSGTKVATSHFGYGILTFSFDVYFRTPPGYNVLARGPANAPKDGIGPLEGVVETDWALVPFTMNWKLTRPGSVSFAAGEPFCQLVPQRRGELERFQPRTQAVASDEAAQASLTAWRGARLMYRVGKRMMAEAGAPYERKWMDDYFRGRTPGGDSAPEHQTKLSLRPLR